MRVMGKLAFLALVLSLAMGCDDSGDGGGEGGAGGSGGEGGAGPDMGAVAGSQDTFTFTQLELNEPGAVAPLLTNLLNTNLNAGAIIVLVQIDGWGGGGDIVLRGGAGQQVDGAETPDDLLDDTFTWLTDGQCATAEGTVEPCSVEIHERAGTQDGEMFTMTDGEIAIYAEDLQLIIPIKGLTLSGTRDGSIIDCTLQGVITDADAAETRFKLSPDAAEATILKGLLNNVGIMPDTELAGEPAYTFAGTFSAELITFVDQ